MVEREGQELKRERKKKDKKTDRCSKERAAESEPQIKRDRDRRVKEKRETRVGDKVRERER